MKIPNSITNYLFNSGSTLKGLNAAKFILFGITALGCLMIYFSKVINPVAAINSYLFTAFSLFIVGASIGFLFGLPRINRNTVITNGSAETIRNGNYNENTNLEEVSDWLTKIIVGLTMVKINTILSWIDSGANTLSRSLSTDHFSAYGFAYASIVFYFLAGCGMSYYWTRVFFWRILEQNKREVERLSKDEISEKQALANPDLSRNTRSNLENFVETNDVESSFISKAILADFNRKVNYKNDIQKDRWGGKYEDGNYKLSAFVNQDSKDAELFNLNIRVDRLKDDQAQNLAFFLHDTFNPKVIFKSFDGNTAYLNIKAYGAFTIGVLTDSNVELELDLAKLEGAPELFRMR